MLTSNTEKKNTNSDIKLSEEILICLNVKDILIRVKVNNETGYHTYIEQYNTKTMEIYPIITLTLKNYQHPIILPNSLLNLNISKDFNQPIILPNSLRILKISEDFNKFIILPTSLKYLHISGQFNQPIILPNTLIELNIKNNSKFNQPIILPVSSTIFVLKLNGDACTIK